MTTQSAKTLADLREHLFATLEALRDENKPMDIERAKAIAGVAKTVIDSAKVEVAYIKTVGEEGYSSPFLGGPALPAPRQEGNGGAIVRTHRIR